VQAHAGVQVAIECVFEAGYDGFWLHRRLAQAGIESRVMDPAARRSGERSPRAAPVRLSTSSSISRSAAKPIMSRRMSASDSEVLSGMWWK